MLDAFQQPGGRGGLLFVLLQNVYDLQACGTHHVRQGIVLQQHAGTGMGGPQGGKPVFQIQQALLQGSGIAPDGFRLFRAGTDQGLGHGPGHLGRSSRRSEDMRVVIVMMIVPFFLMVGAAGKQGDALAAVGFAGFGLGQGRGESCLQAKAVHQDHVRSRHLGQVGRGRRVIMRAAGGGRDQQVEPDIFQTGHQRTGQLPDGVRCCQDMDGS